MDKCLKIDGFKDGLPIVMGFIPIAMAFGILCKSANISFIESLSFSMIVFAGASQFIAVNLLIAGASIGEIVITTLLVNLRHFLFAASLSTKITEETKGIVPIIAFGLSDEIFSVASLKKKELTREYLITLESCAYVSLSLGTVLGYFLGSILPEYIQISMGIALYALFAAILVPEMKKSKKITLLILLSGAINSICLYVFKFSLGSSLIVSIILVSSFGVLINTKQNEVTIE